MSLWRDFNYCLTCKYWVHTDNNNHHINNGHVLWGAGVMPGARYFFGRRMYAVYIQTLCQMREGSDNQEDAGSWLPWGKERKMEESL